MMRLIKVLLILQFLLISITLFSESMDQNELIEKTGSRLLWDPEIKKGILIKENQTIAFMADESLLLLNGKDVFYTAAIVYEKGILKFSSDTVEFISRFFLSEKTVKNPSGFRVAAIILDAGHGGRDSGATSYFPVDGITVPIYEKNLVLDLTLSLEEKLSAKYNDKEIILTRRTDIYPTLEERVELANSFNLKDGEGIIYISLHANASLNKKASGFEIWYLPEDYRRQILGDDGSVDRLDPVLNTLMEEEFTLESKKLAGFILDNLKKTLGDTTPNRGIKEESWFVVRNAMMASVLIEAGFLTNSEETVLLRDPEYLMRLNNGIYNGII
ncbi:N-acetylmuramoyl-L-alanine amidase, partial [Oceanispirochaeta sp.]|uniref:N-acetylmuramoyl-L-alanine amidase family protein n=1 Tax=Oceanispirochaeta sp. TaxID=2035350 RepID=UPI00263255DB